MGEVDMKIRIGSLELANPFILGAGPPGITGASLKRFAATKPGAVVTKSIGVNPSPGQKLSLSRSALSEDSLVLTDPWSFKSFEQWVEHEIPFAQEGGVPVIISLQAVTDTPGDDIKRMAGRAEQAGVAAIELSAFGSAPNVVTGEGIGAVQDAKRTYEVAKAAKESVNIPVIVKLLPEPSNLVDLVKAAEDAGADAIASRDTIFPAITFDIYTKEPPLARNIGTWMPELSGRSIKEVALAYVVEIFRRTSLPLIGLGGVARWQDAVEMVIAGATGIGVCTAAMTRGPEIFTELKKGLAAYLRDQKVTLDQLRGTGLEGMMRVNQRGLAELLVEIDAGECTMCGTCATVCQVEAPREREDAYWINPDVCVKCGMCVHYCPVSCIEVREL
ncbi:MAG TPA: 4Fe-4S binding protein [Anaerolineae bacterium]|nr:4Fe-4S binding protein [Anaerolineae bacterium]